MTKLHFNLNTTKKVLHTLKVEDVPDGTLFVARWGSLEARLDMFLKLNGTIVQFCSLENGNFHDTILHTPMYGEAKLYDYNPVKTMKMEITY